MLEYVPVRFDLYRPLAPRLRWTLQCLVAFADRTGTCWPSVRKLAEVSGVSKSSVSRHLAALVRSGVISRQRRPGGSYIFHIAARFLPASAKVSHSGSRTVPPAPKEENPIKKTFAKSFKEGSDVGHENVAHDDSSRWEARLRGWHKRRMWLPFWGPRPDQPGCWAPNSNDRHSQYTSR